VIKRPARQLFLESAIRDVRVGLRLLRKDKSFFILTLVALGLGIGSATTQFAMVDAVVLRGFSFPHSEELMRVGLIDPHVSTAENNFGLGSVPTLQDYEDLRAAQSSFSQMAGCVSGSTITLTYKSNARRYTGAYVTDGFFKITGVSPIMGRDFSADDNKPGAERVTIVAHDVWRRDFNADPNIIGQNVLLNGRSATVIGVMPPDFKFPLIEDFWVPLYNEYPLKPRGNPDSNNWSPLVIGRLKPRVNLGQVNIEFTGLARRLAQDNPKTNGNLTSASVEPLPRALIGPWLRQTAWAMFGATILVLLIACVNVMNMQFGRATLRARELAIRGALGATRCRIVRQMLIESSVVVIFGALVGVLLAYFAVHLYMRAANALPFPFPYWIRFRVDPSVLAFTVGITFVATTVSSLAPALVGARGNPAEMLKNGGRGHSYRFVNMITRSLVIGQIALTTAVLIAAMLQIKSVRNELALNYGYDENAVYTARIALMEGAYPQQDAQREFFRRAILALRANPEFDSAAMTSRFRMTVDRTAQYEVDGHTYLTAKDRPHGNVESVSDDYFGTLGLKILEGRDFTIDDSDASQPVAIVNLSFARKYYGRESPIGRRIRIYNPDQPQAWRTIVGVVPDTLMQGPLNVQSDNAGFYIPLLGAEPPIQFCTLIVRPRPGQRADTLGPALSRGVAQLDMNLPTYAAGTPARLHDEILVGDRNVVTLFVTFGTVAFALSAVGLYGVMSFSVSQRTREFGIRMALGADAARVFRMVMTQGAWQLIVGFVLGAGGVALLFGVLAAAPLQQMLFKVNALDPAIYFSVAALLTIVAAASCLIPARRATQVDPMVALRYE
jgi:putative ABC transport system permease protein